ncbi:MAG: hypothetical protein DRO12_03895 [Thermoprotei archaeon]|nr:MAG: hypothetical protein DRO12_03895 [Thermoprotei archaeon]
MAVMLKLPKRMEEALLAVYGDGKRESEVAKELGVSKQAVSKFVREGRARLTEIFLEVTEVLHADLVRINLSKGYAIIKPRQLRVKAYVFYVPGSGPRVLFEGDIRCSEEARTLCREVVKAVKAWGLIKACSGVDDEEGIIRCVIKLLEE